MHHDLDWKCTVHLQIKVSLAKGFAFEQGLPRLPIRDWLSYGKRLCLFSPIFVRMLLLIFIIIGKFFALRHRLCPQLLKNSFFLCCWWISFFVCCPSHLHKLPQTKIGHTHCVLHVCPLSRAKKNCFQYRVSKKQKETPQFIQDFQNVSQNSRTTQNRMAASSVTQLVSWLRTETPSFFASYLHWHCIGICKQTNKTESWKIWWTGLGRPNCNPKGQKGVSTVSTDESSLQIC